MSAYSETVNVIIKSRVRESRTHGSVRGRHREVLVYPTVKGVDVLDIRLGKEEDYTQLAEMKWLHCEEDDIDYGGKRLVGVDKNTFIAEFIEFLAAHKEYKIFVACDGKIIASAMFVYLIPKTPKPKRSTKYIAYLTNVYTRKEYRNKGIGTVLLQYIKEQLTKEQCEMLFAWPSANSVNWYVRNAFYSENEMLECDL